MFAPPKKFSTITKVKGKKGEICLIKNKNSFTLLPNMLTIRWYYYFYFADEETRLREVKHFSRSQTDFKW